MIRLNKISKFDSYVFVHLNFLEEYINILIFKIFQIGFENYKIIQRKRRI